MIPLPRQTEHLEFSTSLMMRLSLMKLVALIEVTERFSSEVEPNVSICDIQVRSHLPNMISKPT